MGSYLVRLTTTIVKASKHHVCSGGKGLPQSHVVELGADGHQHADGDATFSCAVLTVRPPFLAPAAIASGIAEAA